MHYDAITSDAGFPDLVTRHQSLLEDIELHQEENKYFFGEAPKLERRQYQPKEKFYEGNFNVPRTIYELLLGERNNLGEKLNKELEPKNYSERFKILLWIEEACANSELRQFDLTGQNIIRDGQFYKLEIPEYSRYKLAELMPGCSLTLINRRLAQYYEGIIHHVRRDCILFKPHKNFYLSGYENVQFNIYFFTLRIPFMRNHNGIARLYKASFFKSVTFPVERKDKKSKVDQLTGMRYVNLRLNNQQKKAIKNILKGYKRPAPYIIFGPPGTGKTLTVVQAIIQVHTLLCNSQILVCANSNLCTDHLTEKLLESGRIPEDKILRLVAHHRFEQHLVPESIKRVAKRINQISLEDYGEYRIVLATCSTSSMIYEFERKFDYVFIDEAGHSSEPEASIALCSLKEDGCCVLAGDFKQLGPVCRSPRSFRAGLGTSYLERLSEIPLYKRFIKENGKLGSYNELYITKLVESYRCDKRILTLNNELFYDKELQLKEFPETKELMKLMDSKYPIIFQSVQGRDEILRPGKSRFNRKEAVKCLDYVEKLYNIAKLKPDQIGIITPYRAQRDHMEKLFEAREIPLCKIATVDGFQGEEREVIIISTVRAYDQRQGKRLDFVFDPKRFNVATSRAKFMVIVIGDDTLLEEDKKQWNVLIDKTKAKGSFRSYNSQI